MLRRRFHPLPYAPAGAFVWNKERRVHGVTVRPGDSVDKSLFDERRLRALYEQRTIVPAPFGEEPAPAYLENGRGEADRVAAQLQNEEGGDEDAAEDSADAAAAGEALAVEPAGAPPAPKPRAAKTAAKRKALKKVVRKTTTKSAAKKDVSPWA